ncbi:MAG: MarR family transcriptional regulator [Thermoleophilia bacterium]
MPNADPQSRAHADLSDAIVTQLQELWRAGDQLDEAVAQQFGLNRTDLRCLGLLYRCGRITAGELAEESGLSPGAMTTVLDRLERGGYAQRVPDAADRRRVQIVSTVATREIGARLYGEVECAARHELARRSAAELVVIRDFLQCTCGVYESQIAAITAESAPGAGRPESGVMHRTAPAPSERQSGGESSAPLGGAEYGRLEFSKGAARLEIRGASIADDLYRATFAGPVPEIDAAHGQVVVRQRRRFRPLDWRQQSSVFALTTTVPWEIVVRGGLWKLHADLTALRVRGLEVGGGSSDVEVLLPEPVGSVRVRVLGGAGRVVVRRPRGSAARAEVSGGAGRFEFDGRRLGVVGGRAVVVSPGFGETADRYEIRFAGGASEVAVETL